MFFTNKYLQLAQPSYQLSPKLSDYLNAYKLHRQNEYLTPPEPLHRGAITASDIKEKASNEAECKALIKKWAQDVYAQCSNHHDVVDVIAKGFLKG